jgi:hypothetical protein
MQHRKLDRASWRAMTVLFLVASVGVALYLNLKAGPSYGIGYLPEGASHEARERDYFFILAWVTWGLWAGMGALHAAKKAGHSRGVVIPLGLALAASPVVMNWSAVDRSRSTEASQFGGEILAVTPRNAVLLAHGDNDTYPVWYLKEVAKMRPDVAAITVPMLPTRWYRQEIAARYDLLDSATVDHWQGTEATVRVICERAGRQSRPVVGPFNSQDKSLPVSCRQ